MVLTFVERVRAALLQEPEVELAFLFGSRALGRASPASDADLAVDAHGADLLALAGRLSLALGVEVDVVDLEAAGYPLLGEVVKHGIVVAEKRRGAAAAWRSGTLAMLETDRPWYARMRDAYLARLARGEL